MNSWITNIMNRKATEEALRESEERYRTLVASVNEAIILQEKTGEILTWNRAAERLFGVTAREVLGHTATCRKWKTIREDGTEFSDSEHPSMHTLATGEVCKNVVMGITSAEGRFSWVNINTSPLFRQGDAKPYAVVISLLDITERKQAEEAVQYSETRFKDLFNNMGAGVAVYEAVGDGDDFIFRNINRAAEKIDNISRQDVLGRSVLEIFPGIKEFGLFDVFQRVWRTGVHEQHPISLYQDNRIAGWRENYILKLRSGEIVAIYEDVTEYKRAEEALRESESRYRSVVEDQTEFICRFAPDGTLTFVNDAYCRYFGLKREECIGKRHSVVLPPDDLSLMKKHIRSLTLENPVATIRHRIIMPSGEVRWQRWSDRAIFDESGTAEEYQSVGRDITDVVNAEESLKENEGRLNAIIRGSPIPQFIIDRNHRVIKWNEALEKYSGIKAEEVIGTDQHWKAFYQQERPCMADLLVDEKLEKIPLWYSGKCARSKLINDAYEATDFFPKLGKTGIWLHFTAAPIRDLNGAIIGAIETLEDITERKMAEAALRESENRYRAVVEDQTEFICRFAPDGTLTFVNDAYCRYFGLNKDRCIGSRHSVVLPADDARQMKKHLAELTPENPVGFIEHRIIMPSGEVRWQRWSDRAIFDKDGHVVEYQSVGKDITERKKAEETLRKSQFLLAEAMDLAHLVNWEFDVPSGIFTFDDRFYALYGTTPEREGGNQMPAEVYAREFVHPDEINVVADEVNKAINTTDPQYVSQVEHRIIRRDGEIRHIVVRIGITKDANGRTIKTHGANQDITERKRAQFQSEALIKELEQKNAELERFTYTVSHDLKSPLITIRGFLGLLEEDALKADTVSLKKDLNRIKSATNTMEDLLRDLLTLSRIGRIVSPPAMVSFTTIAEDAVELLEGAIQQREVTVEIAPDMPVVNVDRDRVREAVMNLVENAIKFMGDQPHPKIEIGVRYDRDQPVFFVKDNGIGIDPQYHKKIFGLFEKLSAKTEGSGTGLAIVQRIIEVHRGRIWVESAGANQGSTFYFSLPVAGADGTDTHKNEEKAE